MAISEPWELDGVTVGAAELSIISGTTTLATDATDGVYQVWVDPVTNMAKGDEFKIRCYEKVEGTGGVKRVFCSWSLAGAQTENFPTPTFILLHGFDFTIQKITGTDRAFDASVRKVG
jgi:hypothetical protein